MAYKNITHDLEIVSEEQKNIFTFVEILLDNLNSVKPSHVNLNKLHYSDGTFKVVNFGFMHNFLLKDIDQALLKDLNTHKDFIIDKVRDVFKDYDKNVTKLLNAKIVLEALIIYYTNYPLYLENEDFKNYIIKLNNSIQLQFVG